MNLLKKLIASFAIMKLALIIFIILIENQFIDSSLARRTKDVRGSKLFQKYSKETPRLIDRLRKKIKLPKEKSKEEVLKYFNAYIVTIKTDAFYNTLFNRGTHINNNFILTDKDSSN